MFVGKAQVRYGFGPFLLYFSIMKNILIPLLSILLFSSCADKQRRNSEESAYRSLAELQHEFVNTRFQAYFHYNMCTFKNYNEGSYQGRSNGEEPVEWFNPSGLDVDQWVEACKIAGMEGGWLTTKHHGGFCLWDSEFTDYDVASAPVKTDIVKEFTDKFRAAGMKVGLYYSILDYHHGIINGDVSNDEIAFIKHQITELLTNYGKIDYINFDGWSTWPSTPNFDDIHYGEILRLVKSLQPECLIISHTYESNLAHAEIPFADAAGRNYPFHPDYMRPTAASDFLECGWWWNDNNDWGVRKSVDYLLGRLDSYNSHNSVYILNLSPNIYGRIDDRSVQRLEELAAVWKKPADIPMEDNWGYQYDTEKNLAFMKQCTQSSLHKYVRDKRAYPRAEIAVDGVTEGNAMMEQCAWTQKEMQPWWRVDLGKTQPIKSIEIFERTDNEMGQLRNFTVSVLDRAGNTVWSQVVKTIKGSSIEFELPKVEGRFVKVQLNGEGELLLAEVIVQ